MCLLISSPRERKDDGGGVREGVVWRDRWVDGWEEWSECFVGAGREADFFFLFFPLVSVDGHLQS